MFIEERSQKRVKGHRFYGPDHYLAVQIVPEGVDPLKTLNVQVAKKRGIKIIRCGEFYTKRRGARSRYRQAYEHALELKAAYEKGGDGCKRT